MYGIPIFNYMKLDHHIEEQMFTLSRPSFYGQLLEQLNFFYALCLIGCGQLCCIMQSNNVLKRGRLILLNFSRSYNFAVTDPRRWATYFHNTTA